MDLATESQRKPSIDSDSTSESGSFCSKECDFARGARARSRTLSLAAAWAVVALLGGCASLPDREAGKPSVVASAPSAQLITCATAAARWRGRRAAHAGRVKAEGGGALLEHHLRVLAASGDVDLYRNNATRLLVDGPATFAAMKAAIAQARQRVLLESYIVEDSRDGRRDGGAAARKVRQGVQVALMYDAVGSLAAPTARTSTRWRAPASRCASSTPSTRSSVPATGASTTATTARCWWSTTRWR